MGQYGTKPRRVIKTIWIFILKSLPLCRMEVNLCPPQREMSINQSSVIVNGLSSTCTRAKVSKFIITDVWQHLILNSHSVNRFLFLSPTLLGKKARVCVCTSVCVHTFVAWWGPYPACKGGLCYQRKNMSASWRCCHGRFRAQSAKDRGQKCKSVLHVAWRWRRLSERMIAED